MASEDQDGHESYRVIVLRPGGTEVLLGWYGDQFALPSVEIPAGNRTAETLTAAIKTDWGEEVVCLFETDTEARRGGTRVRFQAAEHWRTSSRPKLQTRWLPVATLLQDSLIDPYDFSAIREVIAECGAEMRDSSLGPFARLGWFRELREWVSGVIEPQGFYLHENFRQMNASPLVQPHSIRN